MFALSILRGMDFPELLLLQLGPWEVKQNSISRTSFWGCSPVWSTPIPRLHFCNAKTISVIPHPHHPASSRSYVSNPGWIWGIFAMLWGQAVPWETHRPR